MKGQAVELVYLLTPALSR